MSLLNLKLDFMKLLKVSSSGSLALVLLWSIWCNRYQCWAKILELEAWTHCEFDTPVADTGGLHVTASTDPANVWTALLSPPPLLSSGSLPCRAMLQHSVEFHSVCVKESEPLAFREKPLLGTPARLRLAHALCITLSACVLVEEIHTEGRTSRPGVVFACFSKFVNSWKNHFEK